VDRPAFGGLFHLFRSISKPFREKRRFDNELREFHRRSPSFDKTSTAQNGTKTIARDLLRSFVKSGATPTPRLPFRLPSGSNGFPLCAIKSNLLFFSDGHGRIHPAGIHR
jgi:hypothetical protein